jgi:hypothetical protein
MGNKNSSRVPLYMEAGLGPAYRLESLVRARHVTY